MMQSSIKKIRNYIMTNLPTVDHTVDIFNTVYVGVHTCTYIYIYIFNNQDSISNTESIFGHG